MSDIFDGHEGIGGIRAVGAMLALAWRTKRPRWRTVASRLWCILALRQTIGGCPSGCVPVGWMCGYRLAQSELSGSHGISISL
jgi:hypothetical protein